MATTLCQRESLDSTCEIPWAALKCSTIVEVAAGWKTRHTLIFALFLMCMISFFRLLYVLFCAKKWAICLKQKYSVEEKNVLIFNFLLRWCEEIISEAVQVTCTVEMENRNIVPRERGNGLKILNEFSMHCSIWPVALLTTYNMHCTFSPPKTVHILGKRKLNPCKVMKLQAPENRWLMSLINHACSSA